MHVPGSNAVFFNGEFLGITAEEQAGDVSSFSRRDCFGGFTGVGGGSVFLPVDDALFE
jgi:hypothetical protein